MTGMLSGARTPAATRSHSRASSLLGSSVTASWVRHERIDLRFPGENRLSTHLIQVDQAIGTLRNLGPPLAHRRVLGPGRHDVLAPRPGLEVREVSQHDDRRYVRSTALPDQDTLAGLEVDVDEVGVVDAERRRPFPEVDQPLDVREDVPPNRCQPIVRVGAGQPAEVDRIDLLAAVLGDVAVLVEDVMLVGKLLPGQDHRDADRRQQAGEGELDPLPDLLLREPAQHREESLVALALDIMLGDVVHRVGPVGETHEPAIDRLADRPFEGWLVARVLAEDGGPDTRLETLVPQPVETPRGLTEQVERERQLLANDQEPGIGPSTKPLTLPALIPDVVGALPEVGQEVPVGDVLDAVDPDAIQVEVAHPAEHLGQHELARGKDRLHLSGDRIVRLHGLRVPPEGAAETVPQLFAPKPAR